VPADTREHLGLERLTAPRHQLRIVAEHGDRVWCSHQELGRKPARGEHLGHPLRRGALIAQQPQVPRGLSECVADPAETGQPRIRLRGIGKPAQHDRQQRPLDGRAAADPAGESLDVAQGTGRVRVAERLQSLAGRIGREPGFVAGQPCHRSQQRAIEQLLVQATDLPGVSSPGLEQLADGFAQAEGATQPTQLVVGLRDDVSPPEPLELDPVLERTQEPVRLIEYSAVLTADVTAGGQLGQRRERGTRPQR
jgi:hypothetical protein